MKQRLIIVLTAATLAISFAAPMVVSADHEVTDRPCEEIESGSGQTFADGTNNYDATAALQTSAKCGRIVFTLYIYEAETDCSALTGTNIGTPLAIETTHRMSSNTEGKGLVSFFANNVDDDGIVGAFVTSSFRGAVFDRAPDTGCIELSTSPPAGGFH